MHTSPVGWPPPTHRSRPPPRIAAPEASVHRGQTQQGSSAMERKTKQERRFSLVAPRIKSKKSVTLQIWASHCKQTYGTDIWKTLLKQCLLFMPRFNLDQVLDALEHEPGEQTYTQRLRMELGGSDHSLPLLPSQSTVPFSLSLSQFLSCLLFWLNILIFKHLPIAQMGGILLQQISLTHRDCGTW